MCIYCGTKNYRKIYKNHFGPILKDQDGRTYHVHHIDGNRENNDPSNLKAVSVQEHFNIHFEQKDYAACVLLGAILNLTDEELGKMSSDRQKNLVNLGKHPWQKRGKEAPGYNHTIFTFENIKTGEQVTMTQGEFCSKYQLSIYGISQLVNHRSKTIYGWKLAGTNHLPNRRRGKNSPNYDSTIFNLEHIKTGKIVSMTKHEFYMTYNIKVYHLTNQSEKFKTTAGWKLAETCIHTGPLYKFENMITGEKVEMYRKQFYEKYHLNNSHVCQMVRENPKFKSVKKWKMIK